MLVIPDKDEFHRKRIIEKGKFIKDLNEEKLCPLHNLLLTSKTLNEKQKNSLALANKYSFPQVELVDFNNKAIKTGKEEIELEWDSMTFRRP